MFTKDEFEKIVEQAVSDLPSQFATKLQNVEIIVEEEPTAEQMMKLKLSPHSSLFGLYEGTPLVHRNSAYSFVLPDKITIFQKPIEARFSTPHEIVMQVRRTLLHEIGHHFGLSEDDLHNTKVG